MLSSLEALDDPPGPTVVPRAGAFQPKAKPRARKPANNASNITNKTKVNIVENKPKQPAEVHLSQATANPKEVSVTLPVSLPQTKIESPVIPSSPPEQDPVEEIPVLVHLVQEPSVRVLVTQEVPPLSPPGENSVEEIPVFISSTREGLSNPPVENTIQKTPVCIPSIQEPVAAHIIPLSSSPVENPIDETTVFVPLIEEPVGTPTIPLSPSPAKNSQPEEHLPLLREACVEYAAQDNAESHASHDASNAHPLSPMSCSVVQGTANPIEDEKPQTELRRSKRKAVIPSRYRTTVGNMGCEAWETKVSCQSNKQSNIRDQQSQNGTSEPKSKRKPKYQMTNCAQYSTGMEQGIIDNRGIVSSPNAENPPEEGADPVNHLDDKSNNQSRHQRQKMAARKSAPDSTIMQQGLLKNGEYAPGPNTENLPEERVTPLNELDEKNIDQSRWQKKKMRVRKAVQHSAISQHEIVENRNLFSASNTKDLPEEVALVHKSDKSDAKNNNQSIHRRQKMKVRKAANDSTIMPQEILENRENVSVLDTETLLVESDVLLSNLDDKNNNQSRHRKRKSMSTKEALECDDSNAGIHKVVPPLHGQEFNENVTTKQRQQKKAASKNAESSLEGSKKRFTHSTRSHRRRVEKRLMDTPEVDLDRSKLTMKDIIRLAEAKERRLNKEEAARKKSHVSETTSNSIAKESSKPQQEDEGFTLAPQVQVVNGQIVINEDSLVVSARDLNADDVQTYRRVEESSSKLNYHTYMNRTPVERWSKSDTELFYKAMQQFGTNFAMIQHLFPGRTRRQVKAKFKKEERQHPLQLADALVHRSQDHSHYQMVIDQLKISSEPPEHDHLGVRHARSASLENQSIEDSDEAHEEREVDMHQIISTLNSPPKTQESDASAHMRPNEKDSAFFVENFHDHSENDVRNTCSTTLIDLNMIDSNVVEEASPNPEIVNNESIGKPAKCLFSYQSSSSKPVKSLFSYQRT